MAVGCWLLAVPYDLMARGVFYGCVPRWDRVPVRPGERERGGMYLASVYQTFVLGCVYIGPQPAAGAVAVVVAG